MSVLNPGTTFANGEQLTAVDLNLLVQGATFTQSSIDNQSTQISGTAIIVADGGIITSKLAANAVTTSKILDANVTTDKIADDNVTTDKIADANVTFAKLTDVIDDDTMDAATDTTLATSESIKAYVDSSVSNPFIPSTYDGEESVTLPNGLIMKFGSVTAIANSNTAVTFAEDFTSTVIAQLTIKEDSTGDRVALKVASLTNSTLTIRNTTSSLDAYWMVIGK